MMKSLSAGQTRADYKDYLVYIFLMMSAALAYFRIAGNGFVNLDDPLQLTGQVHILTGLTWSNFIYSFSLQSWCGPVTWLAYTVCYELFGLNPLAFHIMSLAIHIACSILLFVLLKSMTGAFWRSAFVSALFALHPINVESVAWVAELNNVISGLFFMLTLLAYHVYTRKPGWTRYILAVLAFGLGLLAKPVLMTLPGVLILIDYWPLRRILLERGQKSAWALKTPGTTISRIVLEKVPFVMLSAASLMFNLKGANVKMGLYSDQLTSASLRLSNGIVSIVKYLGKMFWPHDLVIFYPYPDMVPLWQVAGASLVIGLLTFAAFKTIRRYPYVFVGWLWFLGSLVPFLGFFQAGLWPEMADRYAYLSFIGIFLILSWGVFDLAGHWKHYRVLAVFTGAATVCAMVALTWVQTGVWKDSETLFNHTLAKTQNNFVAHNSLGVALFDKGDLEGAKTQFLLSLEIEPYYLDARSNLASVHYEQNNYDEAIVLLRECIRINPLKAGSYAGMGHAMMEAGNLDEAIRNFTLSLQIDPYQEKVCYRLGEAYCKKGDSRKGIEFFRESLRINPDFALAAAGLQKAQTLLSRQEAQVANLKEALDADPGNLALALKLADALRQMGRYEDSIARFNKVLAGDPGSTAAMYGLVLVYTNTYEYKKAIDMLERMRQVQPDNATIYYNMACLYAKQDMKDDAVAWLKQAVGKGFNNADLLRKDPDLANIRNTPYVNELIKNTL